LQHEDGFLFRVVIIRKAALKVDRFAVLVISTFVLIVIGMASAKEPIHIPAKVSCGCFHRMDN
jgi:hypothetical protein